MSQNRGRRRKGRYPVTYPAKLAGMLQASLNQQFAGNQRAAARALAGQGCQQRELNRLVRGEIGALTERTVQWVAALVGRSQHNKLWGVLLTPEARGRLALYDRWMTRRLEHTPTTEPLETRLRRKHPTPFAEFDSFLEERGYADVVSTNPKVRTRHRSPRAELAFREVLVPFRRSPQTAQIERGLNELSPREIESYLRHAFAAQRVLLRRPLDIDRAQSVPALEGHSFPARP